MGDFTKAACRLFGRDYGEMIRNWPRGEFNIESRVLGLTQGEFFAKLSEAGPSYWEEIEPYPHFRELWGLAESIAPTYVLTRPSPCGTSADGKMRWMHRHLGRDFENFLIGCPKEACAAPGHLLIDDHPGNVAKFRAAGGDAILFPREWNERHSDVDWGADLVMRELQEWAGRSPTAG